MGKRRRERDRPKAGPEALSNPNKRVLLSYASDGDEDEYFPPQPESLPCGGSHNRQVTDYQIDEYPDSEDADHISAAQDTVLDHADGAIQRISKEQVTNRHDDRGGIGRDVIANWATGQRPTLGSLSYQYETGDENDTEPRAEEGYNETSEDAVAYLKAVREQRHMLPHIFTAPSSAFHGQTSVATHEGMVHGSHETLNDNDMATGEHAIASYETPRETEIPAYDLSDPQEAYTAALVARFLTQRKHLHQPTSAGRVMELDADHPISFPPGNNNAYADWHRILRTRAPLPAQVRSLDIATVLNLLDLVRDRYLVSGKDIGNNISAWIWSLLARVDEVGTMTNDQIFPLRELGRKAVLVQLWLVSPALASRLDSPDTNSGISVATCNLPSSNGGGSPGRSSGPAEEDDITTDSSMLDKSQSSVRQNTLATLDMILTVVGDLFGQRDLLEHRQAWSAEVQPG